MKSLCRVILTAAFLAYNASVLAGEPALIPARQPVPQPPAELLVKVKDGAGAPACQVDALLAKLAVSRAGVPVGMSVSAAAAGFQGNTAVAWVQANGRRAALAAAVAPNDPFFRPDKNTRHFQQWYLPKMNANYAWSISKGDDGMIVGVLDSGVDFDHPDLAGRLLPGVTLISPGVSAASDGRDDNGHGTQLAGLIAAATDNGKGVAGTCWAGKILPIKVLDRDGEGLDSDIAAGIIYAADRGCRILNMSFGGPADQAPQVLQDAVDYASARGCLLLAASGNSGDQTIYYPANLQHVQAVGATDPWDERAPYSTYGPAVTLYAPGGAGGSAFNRDTGILCPSWDANSHITDFSGGSEAGEYAIVAGTSMATALAAGAAVLVWSHDPGLTAVQVADRLKGDTGRLDLLASLGESEVRHDELETYTFPNPFSPERDNGTHIVFFLDAPQGADIKVYDVSRDLVWKKSLSAGETSVGKNIVRWDGRNQVGQAVANGSYYYRVTGGYGGSSRIKVMSVLR